MILKDKKGKERGAILIIIAIGVFWWLCLMLSPSRNIIENFQADWDGSVAFVHNTEEFVVPQNYVEFVKETEKAYSYYVPANGTYRIYLNRADYETYMKALRGSSRNI